MCNKASKTNYVQASTHRGHSIAAKPVHLSTYLLLKLEVHIKSFSLSWDSPAPFLLQSKAKKQAGCQGNLLVTKGPPCCIELAAFRTTYPQAKMFLQKAAHDRTKAQPGLIQECTNRWSAGVRFFWRVLKILVLKAHFTRVRPHLSCYLHKSKGKKVAKYAKKSKAYSSGQSVRPRVSKYAWKT